MIEEMKNTHIHPKGSPYPRVPQSQTSLGMSDIDSAMDKDSLSSDEDQGQVYNQGAN